MNATAIPAAAQSLAEDARAAGLDVKVETYGNEVSVSVSGGSMGRSGQAVWAGAYTGVPGRLGFSTSTRTGVRFSYANVHGVPAAMSAPRSARKFRLALGIPA